MWMDRQPRTRPSSPWSKYERRGRSCRSHMHEAVAAWWGDGPPAAPPALVAVVEVRQPVQIVQVPHDRGVLAVDLQGVERLVPPRVAGRLKGAQRTVLEAGEESAGVVDADWFRFSGQIV